MNTTSRILVDLIAVHLPGDRNVAMMAWSSTNKWRDAHDHVKFPDTRIRGMIRFLIRGSGQYKAHASPFGHPHLTIYFEIPLSVLGHLVRHRSWASFSILSLRFTLWTLLAYMPEQGRRQVGKPGAYTMEPITGWRDWLGRRVMQWSYVLSTLAYLILVKLGWAGELARFVAPEGRMTAGFGTVSLRNALNFCVLRNDDHTMKETRKVAVELEQMIRDNWPMTWKEWSEAGHPQL